MLCTLMEAYVTFIYLEPTSKIGKNYYHSFAQVPIPASSFSLGCINPSQTRLKRSLLWCIITAVCCVSMKNTLGRTATSTSERKLSLISTRAISTQKENDLVDLIL